MKILHTVQFYSPHVGGSEEVVRQLSNGLARRGHQVTVATSYDPNRSQDEIEGVEIKQFRISGNAVKGITGADVGSYVNFVLDGDFDVMMNYAAQTWSTDLLLPELGRIVCAKVLVPCGYSALYRPAYRDYFESLPGYLRDYDRLLYASANYRDKQFGDAHALTHYSIIPNGADAAEFSGTPLGFRERFDIQTPYLLLTVANLIPSKGHDVLLKAFRTLGRDDSTLAIIGKPLGNRTKWLQRYYLQLRFETARIRNARVFEDLEREWVVSAFQEADLFVFASKLECSPLVIYEAMAAGTPFVSTNCGDVMDRRQFGIVVQADRELAPEIGSLLDDDGRRRRLGAAAAQHWQANLTWDHIVEAYERLYESLLH